MRFPIFCSMKTLHWVAVKELKLGYHNSKLCLAAKELNLSYHNMDIIYQISCLTATQYRADQKLKVVASAWLPSKARNRVLCTVATRARPGTGLAISDFSKSVP